MKDDSVDSEKLAKSLKNGSLRGIYIHRKENLDARNVLRLRRTFLKQLGGFKSRVKHLLYNNGIMIPDCFSRPGTHWSRSFMKWLREDVVLLSSTRTSLDMLLDTVELLRKNQLSVTRQIRFLSRSERYANDFENLMSIPGIGLLVGMCLLTEIDDVRRFRNEKQFASYLGLVPMSHSSGEKICNGEKTFRGNKLLGLMLVESAWVTIQHDSIMAAAYGEYCKRMKGQKAIIRIARKLANRIFHVMKNGQKYEYDKCR